MKYRLITILYVLIASGATFAAVASDNATVGVKSSGPTIKLDYGNTETNPNPAKNFLYFVPLVSPTLVGSTTSQGNSQTARVISFSTKRKGNRFTTVCDFEMAGQGYHTNQYDPVSMIEKYSKVKKDKTLKNMLDYIKVEGSGFGSMEITGKTRKDVDVVDQIKVHFNKRDCKSPISIGMYSVKKSDDKFEYDNRFDEMIVRVNTLIFKRSKDTAKMQVVVASITGSDEKEGFWSNLKGALANIFIPPVEVDKAGNKAMLDFGLALSQKQQSFTFPKAKNLITETNQLTFKWDKSLADASF